ncbi:MAG: single-stranded DNA-binding protein [Bacteroidales bacterium]|nr:single-stranded DNA-binding protein [Bacteroidales bacterium]
MANGINKVILIGHLGKDPDVQVFEGAKRASFTLATDESYRDKDGNKVERVEWHSISMWRGLADVAERFLRKGAKVYVEGKLRTRTYPDESGKQRYFTEILAENMVMLDRKESGDAFAAKPTAAPAAPQFEPLPESDITATPPVDDDLPF